MRGGEDLSYFNYISFAKTKKGRTEKGEEGKTFFPSNRENSFLLCNGKIETRKEIIIKFALCTTNLD